ncbi:dNTP triphosphohydrolase [Priestia aryabhattai]|uniref:DNTP triphosphohydrolase n=1 Tax=Priestia aryabhattai TaxID=412384 RepID=A0AAX6N5R1_PRIAR|nr:dNTP triphosphohydrolase [Priestia aryabhattai]MDU9691127.1 dNTP triphosphohydrolase [Priestia aryabhattai]
MEKMRWEDLLNEKRRRPKHKEKEEDKFIQNKQWQDHRNEFERDYDRIVSSSSLRRLQDKAQVFPLQDNDFVRTRLTHSIEVSSIARSFGVWLENWLIEKRKIQEKDRRKIPAMLATAGLVHDVGNPPFGHYGEDVIKQWFEEWFEHNKTVVEDNEKFDFLNFDGNAQGIRVLTTLQFLNDRYGINFTYGTLSVLIKYPWDSSDKKAREDKKFGFFQKDIEIGKDIIDNTVRLKNTRNPMTYFLEAADDIAYLGADVEDGVKKGIIPWEKIFEGNSLGENSEIEELFKEITKVYSSEFKEIQKKHEKAKNSKIPDYCLSSVRNFKVWVQGVMMREVMEVFEGNYSDIMKGDFKGESFLEVTENAYKLEKFLRKLLKTYCFKDKEVLSLELVGDSVISDLLTIFVKSILSEKDIEQNHRCKEGKLFRMISDNFIFVHLLDEKGIKNKTMKNLSAYDKLLLITDFISGMTDSYAVDLHQKLKGVKMP